MTSITVRWAGPADAGATSTYKIERSTAGIGTWSTIDATQASTSPYVSPVNTLVGDTAYGATSITLVAGTLFSSTGYGWIDDALVQWTGKSTHVLTGVTWHSGAGTYAAGTSVYEAHESVADTATASLGAVLYRITHTNPAAEVSAPAYQWYYIPAVPESSDHCVVIVNLQTDLGFEPQSGILVDCYIAADTSFGDHDGAHVDAGASADKQQTTNAFGLAFFHCWKSSRRSPITGTDAAYKFVLDSSGGSDALTVTAATIPDRDWVLLSQIATA